MIPDSLSAQRLIGAASLLMGLCAGCASPEIQSAWRGADIRVDGSAAEWRGELLEVSDFHSSIGVRNDAENLYLCVTCVDEATIRRIMAAGLTLWVDPEGSEEGGFGVRYPIGQLRTRPHVAPAAEPVHREDRARDAAADRPPGSSDESYAGEEQEAWKRPEFKPADLSEVEVLGPEPSDVKARAVSGLKEIAVAATYESGQLTCEFRLPLHGGSEAPIRLDADSTRILALEFKTGETPGNPRRAPRPVTSDGTTTDAFGRRRTTFPTSAPEAGLPGAVDAWVRIHLASPGSTR